MKTNGKKTVLTPHAKKELEEELKKLLKKRKEIALEQDEARAQGDLSENSWHDAVIEKRELNERRIHEIKEMLKNAIIQTQTASNSQASLGSFIQVEYFQEQNPSQKQKRTFQLVSTPQANPSEGKISIESPLGKLLVGKEEGDNFLYKTPTGQNIKYTIVKIGTVRP